MSHRRFLNLVLRNNKDDVYSLRRIDLLRQHLFYPTPDAAAEDQKRLDLQEMESIRIPAPSVRFQPNPSCNSVDNSWKFHCFGLSENKIICTDNSGLSFIYDAVSRSFGTMPSLHTPKWFPISFTGPGHDGLGSLYVMERVPDRRQGQLEAFLYTTCETPYIKCWQRHSLPPPPYVLDPGYKPAQIDSHAVLGGGSHLCISVQGHGTYCFDTASREWSHAGDWMLPIYGKAEYVPELNLWFGYTESSDRDLLPCVSDLSSVLKGRKPKVCNVWRNHYPPEWDWGGNTKIVNLGSGRLCVVEFFETMLEGACCNGEPVVDQYFAIFTGLELLSSCGADGNKLNGNGNSKGKRRIQMVKHMSKNLVFEGYTTIDAVL